MPVVPVVSKSFLLGYALKSFIWSLWTKRRTSLCLDSRQNGCFPKQIFPHFTRDFLFLVSRLQTLDNLRYWPSELDLHPGLSSFLHTELHSTSCGNPGVPPKAVLSGSGRFAVGDQVQYSCVPGYVLDGHATLTCITNAGNTAVWDFPAPICRGMLNLICAHVFLYVKFLPLKVKIGNN